MLNPYFTDRMKEAYTSHVKHLDEVLKMQLLEYAKPKIKEPITKGKLKWRGIILCQQQYTGQVWLEQRGKVLGEKINKTFDVKYGHSDCK